MAFFYLRKKRDERFMSSDKGQTKVRRIGIAGFGTVGQAVARLLCSERYPNLLLTHIYNRNIQAKRVDWVPRHVVWTDRIEDVLDTGVDIFVELIGGLSPAKEWIETAIMDGKSVVTANKQVIAKHGAELCTLVRQGGTALGFEAAVGGGIPMVRGIQQGLGSDHLIELLGVLNGTCNFIFDRMECEAVTMEEAVQEAQALGYAEADPSDDLDGFDAQAKIAILSAVGLRRRLTSTDIPTRTIKGVGQMEFRQADKLNYVIRQVSRVAVDKSHGDQVQALVTPALVPKSSRLAQVHGAENIIVTRGKWGGESAFVGLGAGGEPTAIAVVGDLLSIAEDTGVSTAMRFPASESTSRVSKECISRHYLRTPTVLSHGMNSVPDRLKRNGVEVEKTWQESQNSGQSFTLVLTGLASFSVIQETCGEVERDLKDGDQCVWLPILDESPKEH